ncbi:MAG: cytochrome c [Candidatus Binatia bacterium]
MREQRWQRQLGLKGSIGIFVLLVTLLEGSSGFAQQAEVIEAGRKEFRQSCVLCHGLSGGGESVMTTLNLLTITPPDLRRLSQRHEGKFPFWYVYQVIDGRAVIRGHGTRDMPIWGDVFIYQEDGSIENETRAIGRILSLIYYLQSIQEEK